MYKFREKLQKEFFNSFYIMHICMYIFYTFFPILHFSLGFLIKDN